MSFHSDLDLIDAHPDDVPCRSMKMRHKRRTFDRPLLSTSRKNDDLVIALFEPNAKRGAKPVVMVHVEPLLDLDDVQQERLVSVRGWPTLGRAVVIDIDDRTLRPVYPCTTAVFRPIRLRGDDR